LELHQSGEGRVGRRLAVLALLNADEDRLLLFGDYIHRQRAANTEYKINLPAANLWYRYERQT
jgi:hypothetical protein